MPSKPQLPYYEDANGIRYSRVSAILSILRDPDLEEYQERVGDKAAKAKAKHTANVGLTLDAMIKQEVRGETVKWPKPASAEIKQGWKAWREYQRLHRSAFHVGTPLLSDLYGYGGEPDLYEDELVLTDLKATTRIREKFWIQLTAYVPLIWPERLWSRACLRIIRLDTFLGICEVKERPFVRHTWETFMHLKWVYLGWYGTELTKEVPNGTDH